MQLANGFSRERGSNSFLQDPRPHERFLLSELMNSHPLSLDASLNDDHKRLIRCIRQIQLLVARKRFQVRRPSSDRRRSHSFAAAAAVLLVQQARKPYDVRDVLEQYSHGHINMMMRIKELQRK